MTFRLRLALVTGLAVAATAATASGVVYVVMRSELHSSVDEQLRQRWAQIQDAGTEQLNRMFFHFGQPFAIPRIGPTTTANYIQLVQADGATALGRGESAKVPFDKQTLAVAAGSRGPYFTTARVGGKRSRIFTVRAGRNAVTGMGVALQLVRPIDDITRTLTRLRLILLLVVLGGLAAGAAAGALVSRSALVPVRRLSAAAERIAGTGDPSERVPVHGTDELGRLAASFNTMLAALEESLEMQKRFVADASHELRTPLTSLQTNIDVLRHERELEPEQRRQLLADLHRESQEMRSLIGSLLELARGGDARLERTRFQFDELVEASVERARSRFPEVTWAAALEPTVVEGSRDRLERAVWNLLENAGKWSGPGTSVEVSLAGGELRVRDHGPGIAAEDRPRVFERFYRAAAARAMPGSGLGLSIVHDVAEAHGGTVVAEEAPGGGALMRFSLDGAATPNETLTSS